MVAAPVSTLNSRYAQSMMPVRNKFNPKQANEPQKKEVTLGRATCFAKSKLGKPSYNIIKNILGRSYVKECDYIELHESGGTMALYSLV